MPENSSSTTKKIVLFGLAVLFTAWAMTVAVDLLASIWWQLLVIGAVLVGVVVAIATWKSRR